ncbi:Apoptosis-inducing factor 1 [Malassezia cuniculi]|uniref:Apoptosis-inducing factor 1 n=1 Tax=Malassezia cuniculi TaxID=948313 RepID=A0AAF0EYF7_9BASI|nr:Apoptosis-inducing factor 1 [Malassezia cuniculi]
MTTATERIFAVRADELAPGSMREVPLSTKSDSPVNALVANVHGKFYATSSRCTHYGMPLARGVLTGDGRLYCPFHGACFRVTTGDIEDAPAINPLRQIPVSVEDGNVYLHVNLDELAKPVDGVCENPTETKHRTVIVGGGAVAINCAQELRRNNYGGKITIISAEPHAPIDRPKLSKGKLPPLEKLVVRDEAYIKDRLKVNLILKTRVFAIDTNLKRVSMQGKGVIEYDTLVLATGSIPRRLPIEGARLRGVHVMRTLADAEEIHKSLQHRTQNVVVIGTGFIGLEMGMAYGKRANITLIGQTHVPLEGPLGREVGYGVQTTMMNERPIKFLNAVDVVRIEPDAVGDGVSAVIVQPRARGAPELTIPADMVLMSAGAIPATDFLRNSPTFPPLRRDGSVEVDSALRVVGCADVYAGGDIAAYPTANGVQRIEHWNVAANHGREIGRSIATGQPRVFSHIPVFWSGLGSTMRYAGNGMGYDRVYIIGEPDEAEYSAFYGKDDKVIAISTMNTDPVMVQALALMRAGRMPKLSEIASGTDIMKLDASSSVRL